MKDEARVEEAIELASQQYYRLVLLAGLPGTGKTGSLQAVARARATEPVNVNLALSRGMLELTRVQRARQVERLFKDVISQVAGDVVVLDNTEVLFDRSLEVEPLRLLQVVSRNRTVVASWNGTYHDEVLTYGEPGHPEFVQFRKPEAVVVAASAATRG